jgi:outer membrane protein OmpA-like peptidoglycan-associated protein
MNRRYFVIAALCGGSLVRALNAQDGGAPGEGVWANYDFVPGHRIVAAHSFDETYVGHFPDRLEYLAGEMEVVELPDKNRVLRTQNEGRFVVPVDGGLPERFTVEFRVRATDGRAFAMMYAAGDKSVARAPAATLAALVGPQATGLTVGKYTEGPKATRKMEEGFLVDEWVDIRIAVDGAYWKMYAGETRVSNIPQAAFPRGEGLGFFLSIYPHVARDLYIDEIRIAEGGRAMLYEELMARGKVITQGILFDVNSDHLRPESTPTLVDIAEMLDRHPDLRLRIEGHTDNTGSEAINGPLSERRAEAVAGWLVQRRGIDRGRIETQGMGSRSPVADNQSPEGRQENRRVELHRL